jgi:ankyrin repeat protein
MNTAAHKFKGDNGEILYNRSALQTEFEKAVNKVQFDKAKKFLTEDPALALDETFFWSEGVMMMVAKGCHFEMVKLLMSYGAKVSNILKWAQFYYFEKYEMAKFLLENGMDPNVKSWHQVTLLHDMAQKGNIQKAELLIRHGAEMDAIDEEFQSTPLGMAARWGHIEMVKFLLSHGANPNKSGMPWSTPLAWAKKKEHNEVERILIDAGAM